MPDRSVRGTACRGDQRRYIRRARDGGLRSTRPTARAVGPEPEVGLVEVAEQQELAHLPRRRQTDDVADGSRSTSPVAVQPSFSQRRVSVRGRGPIVPAGGVAVGREGGECGTTPSHGTGSPATVTGTVPDVTPLEDAQAFVLRPARRRPRRRRRRAATGSCWPPMSSAEQVSAVRQHRRRRVCRAGRRPR